MAAATGVTYNPTPGIVVTGYATLDPGSIAAAAREQQTIAVPEAKVSDVVLVSPRTTLTDGLVIGECSVLTAGTIQFTIENNHTASIDQGSTVFNWAIIRGATGPASHG